MTAISPSLSLSTLKMESDTFQLIACIRQDDWFGLRKLIPQNSSIIDFALSRLPENDTFVCLDSCYFEAHIIHVQEHMQTPLLLAGFYAAINILKHLMEVEEMFADDLVAGMTVGLVDSVLHAFCLGNSLQLHPSQQYVACFEIVREQLGEERLMKLIRSENHLEMRPLEFSVLLDVYDLFLTYLSCYVTHRRNNGVFLEEIYDLSDYHPLVRDSRFCFSPIRLICEAKAADVIRMEEVKLLSHAVLQSWNYQITKRCIPLFVMYCTLAIVAGIFNNFVVLPRIYTGLYLYLGLLKFSISTGKDYDTPNSKVYESLPHYFKCNMSNYHSSEMLAQATPSFVESRIGYVYFSFTVYLFLILMRITLTLYRHFRWRKFNSYFKKQPKIINILLYDIVLLLLLVSATFYVYLLENLTSFAHNLTISSQIAMDLIMCTGSVCVIVLSLNFVELLPGLAVRTMQLRHTIGTVLVFSVLYGIWLLFFGSIFKYTTPCTNRNTAMYFMNNELMDSINDVFRLSLGIVDFNDSDMKRIPIMHFVFVMLVPTALMNFMIAVMSADIAFIEEHKETMVALNRMNMLWLLESVYLCPGLKQIAFFWTRFFYKRDPEIKTRRISLLGHNIRNTNPL